MDRSKACQSWWERRRYGEVIVVDEVVSIQSAGKILGLGGVSGNLPSAHDDEVGLRSRGPGKCATKRETLQERRKVCVIIIIMSSKGAPTCSSCLLDSLPIGDKVAGCVAGWAIRLR